MSKANSTRDCHASMLCNCSYGDNSSNEASHNAWHGCTKFNCNTSLLLLLLLTLLHSMLRRLLFHSPAGGARGCCWSYTAAPRG
jgi:hypothetical protein